MSKAFTRQDDIDAGPEVPVRVPRVPIPDGVPNYVTAAGARALRAELDRSKTAARIQNLSEHLACAQIVELEPSDHVRFGSHVELVDPAGRRTRYHIVGAIEADPKHRAISWQSPVARALLGARVGDSIALPAGVVVVTAIS